MGKVLYKVRNWREYNRALKERYSLTIWVHEDARKGWAAEPTGRRGRPFTYGDVVIEVCLRVRSLFRLPLRGVEGFMRSIEDWTNMPVPDYTILSRRAHRLNVNLDIVPRNEPVHLVVDSSGLKIYGEGEWKVRTHGVGKRRTWRKIHIGVDEATGRVLVAELTKADVADCDVLPRMLRQLESPVSKVGGDGAYDKKKDYRAIARIGARAIIPPRCDAVANARGRPSARDENIKRIDRIGLKRWKVESGYHRRSLVETAFSRLKRIFGGGLRSRIFGNQRTEAMTELSVMNKMTSLGMPDSYPVN
jgi:hypothetical protein